LPHETDAQFCVMLAILPPGVTVPMHSHDDAEDFFILAGIHQVLTQGVRGLEWRDARAAEYLRVAAGVPHAHRNVSTQPAIELIITTGKLGRLFLEVGRPITDSLLPPTPAEIARFVATARRYGYLLGTAEENAAVGITLPGFINKSESPC
jgi:quercetin dioxygenase-like cupin family protein